MSGLVRDLRRLRRATLMADNRIDTIGCLEVVMAVFRLCAGLTMVAGAALTPGIAWWQATVVGVSWLAVSYDWLAWLWYGASSPLRCLRCHRRGCRFTILPLTAIVDCRFPPCMARHTRPKTDHDRGKRPSWRAATAACVFQDKFYRHAAHLDMELDMEIEPHGWTDPDPSLRPGKPAGVPVVPLLQIGTTVRVA